MKKKLKFALIVISITFVVMAGVLPFIPTGSLNSEEKHLIYITYSKVHTGFLIPKKDARLIIDFLPMNEFKQKEFEGIDFSFGDKDFFEKIQTWDQITLPVILDALFLPEVGLIHVDLYPKISPNHESLKKIYLSDKQFQALIKFILDSFEKQNGRALVYKTLSYYGTDRFFISTRTYHLFHTCNSWIGNGLRNIGVRTGVVTPHKWGVTFHLKP